MKSLHILSFAIIAPGLLLGTASGQMVHDVTVGPGGDMVFSPDAISIGVGDTVRWTWDSNGHNVGSGLPGEPTDAFLSGKPAPAGTVFEVVFDQDFLDANPIEGDHYDYHCHPHGNMGMIGSVEVRPVHDVIVGPAGAHVFSPDEVVVEVGDIVRWTWDSDGHNVGSGLPGEPTDAFLSGMPAPAGTVFEVLFDEAFTDANPIEDDLYFYHCHPHGIMGMIGSIQVGTPCKGDIDGDQIVGTTDLLAMLGAWGPCGDCDSCEVDLDDDCIVGTTDLLMLLGAWGPCR